MKRPKQKCYGQNVCKVYIRKVDALAKQIEGVYEQILSCAMTEFLEKGYTDASLRDIAAKAGTTTGSIYTRFGDKEGLFEAIVGTHYRYLTEKFKNALAEFYKLPEEKKPEHMGEISQNCMKEMLQYGLTHQKEFYLILCKSEGTRFSGMRDEFIEAEIRSTDDYLETLAKLGRPAPEISPHLKHIIVTAMFNGFFEMIIHNMPPKEAESYLRELHLFFEAGWAKIMGQ